MAVFLELTYGRKLGLPDSSHSFSITVRSEVAELKDVDREASKIYCLLQESVDRQIVESGYTPVPLGARPSLDRQNSQSQKGTHPGSHARQSNGEFWNCSDKQRELILKILDEHRLDKLEIERLADTLFQKPVKTLNKLEASGLIEQMIEKYGPQKSNGRNGNGEGRRPYRGSVR